MNQIKLPDSIVMHESSASVCIGNYTCLFDTFSTQSISGPLKTTTTYVLVWRGSRFPRHCQTYITMHKSHTKWNIQVPKQLNSLVVAMEVSFLVCIQCKECFCTRLWPFYSHNNRSTCHIYYFLWHVLYNTWRGPKRAHLKLTRVADNILNNNNTSTCSKYYGRYLFYTEIRYWVCQCHLVI